MIEDFFGFVATLLPPWLARAHGKAFLSVIGHAVDMAFDHARLALEARFVESCPTDGLQVLSADMSVLRCPIETDEQFRNQLKKAWYWQGLRGTQKGLVETLERAGLSVSVFQQIDTSGTPTTDTSARWIVLQLPNDFVSSPLWGSLIWGSFAFGPSTPNLWIIQYIRDAIKLFAPSHWEIKGVWAVMSDPLSESPIDDTWNGTNLFGTSCTLEKVI